MFIPDILPVCSHSIPKSVCKVRWQSKQGLSSYRAYSAKNHDFSAKVAQMSVPLPYSQITSNRYETRQHSVSHRDIYVWIFSSLKDHFLASCWQTTDFLNFGKKNCWHNQPSLNDPYIHQFFEFFFASRRIQKLQRRAFQRCFCILYSCSSCVDTCETTIVGQTCQQFFCSLYNNDSDILSLRPIRSVGIQLQQPIGWYVSGLPESHDVHYHQCKTKQQRVGLDINNVCWEVLNKSPIKCGKLSSNRFSNRIWIYVLDARARRKAGDSVSHCALSLRARVKPLESTGWSCNERQELVGPQDVSESLNIREACPVPYPFSPPFSFYRHL